MHFLNLRVKWVFWAITLVPDMLEGSVDAGDHVVSKKSLSQNFGLLDWRPGLVKVGQKKTKHPHFASLSQANPSPKSKKKIFL